MDEQHASRPEFADINLDLRSALPPLTAIRVFEAVGRYGGIRKAATALSVDHSAVSRHLRALQKWAGVDLVRHASGGGSYLTVEGQLYHQRISRALNEIASAARELCQHGDSNQLRLRAAPGIASEWLMARWLGLHQGRESRHLPPDHA